MPDAEIGVFGGSGFYSFVEGLQAVAISTPYGAPSPTVSVGETARRTIGFLPAAGPHRELPPDGINYPATPWAFKELGATRVIAPCAAGSLQPSVHPGDIVICDQMVDRT